jgi:hypothetical protein
MAFVAAQEVECSDALYEDREQRIAEMMETLDVFADAELRRSGAMLFWAHDWDSRLLSEEIVINATIGAARGHSIVLAVASRYCHSILHTDPIMMEFSKNHLASSSEEGYRLQRDLYRYDFCCKLFGRCRQANSKPPVTEAEVSQLFLPKLEVWEVEEIACIRQYIMSSYENMLKNSWREFCRHGLSDILGQEWRS